MWLALVELTVKANAVLGPTKKNSAVRRVKMAKTIAASIYLIGQSFSVKSCTPAIRIFCQYQGFGDYVLSYELVSMALGYH